MIIELDGGQKIEVQDGATPAQIDEVVGHIQQSTQPVAAPHLQQQNGGILSDALRAPYQAAKGIGEGAVRMAGNITSGLGKGAAELMQAYGTPEMQKYGADQQRQINQFQQGLNADAPTFLSLIHI